MSRIEELSVLVDEMQIINLRRSRGLYAAFNNLPEDEIAAVIKKYRRRYPRSKKSDVALRPMACNTIWQRRNAQNKAE